MSVVALLCRSFLILATFRCSLAIRPLHLAPCTGSPFLSGQRPLLDPQSAEPFLKGGMVPVCPSIGECRQTCHAQVHAHYLVIVEWFLARARVVLFDTKAHMVTVHLFLDGGRPYLFQPRDSARIEIPDPAHLRKEHPPIVHVQFDTLLERDRGIYALLCPFREPGTGKETLIGKIHTFHCILKGLAGGVQKPRELPFEFRELLYQVVLGNIGPAHAPCRRSYIERKVVHRSARSYPTIKNMFQETIGL